MTEVSSHKIDELVKMVEMSIQQKSAFDSDSKKSITILQENHKEVIAWLQRIEGQTVKTNGRVTQLEKENNINKGWVKGISVAGSVIILLIGALYYNLKTIDAQSQQEISKLQR